MHENLQRLRWRRRAVGSTYPALPPWPEAGCVLPPQAAARPVSRHRPPPLGRADLSGVPVVGDSLRDLEAGVALGCTPCLVRTGKGERTLAKPLPAGTRVFADLAAVADHLLEEAP